MNITQSTLYVDFALEEEEFIDEDTVKSIIEASKEVYGDYYDLTIENLIDYTREDTDAYDELMDPKITVFRVYWYKGLAEFLKTYLNLLKNFVVKESPEESMASKACYPVEFGESLLIFSREYFQLHSFKEAANINLADLLIAKKDAYNKSAFERAYTSMITKK